MKHQLLALHAAAVREGKTNYAAELAALYLREYGKPIPSPEVAAVSEFLHSKPPFQAPTSHDHATH